MKTSQHEEAWGARPVYYDRRVGGVADWLHSCCAVLRTFVSLARYLIRQLRQHSVRREKGTGALSLSPSVTQDSSPHTFMRWVGAYRAHVTLHCDRLFSHVWAARNPLFSFLSLSIFSSCVYTPTHTSKSRIAVRIELSLTSCWLRKHYQKDHAPPLSRFQLHHPPQYRVNSMRPHGHHISWLARR
jgi:hypothetical protein